MAITISKKLATGVTATYAKPYSSPSLRLDTGTIELCTALYLDADARFAGATPLDYDRVVIKLTDEQRAQIAAIMYSALAKEGIYKDGEIRDPDPEKITEESNG